MRSTVVPVLLSIVISAISALPAAGQMKLPPPSAKAVSELPWLKEEPKPAVRPKAKNAPATTATVTPKPTKPTPASIAASKPGKKVGMRKHSVTAPEKAAPKKKLVPAKKLFGAKRKAAELKARAIGFYSKGCLAGAARLPDNGKAWQAMRLSRNRHWGHPKMVALLQRFATEVQEKDGWPGLLMGDIAQPRGGPMLTGHASHQIGLDADVWMSPMPKRKLSRKERENISAKSMLAPDKVNVNRHFKPGHVKILKRAANYPSVERILVHPAIKGALCKRAGTDRSWLRKVRPYWGHHYHFHIRMKCPPDSPNCRPQKATKPDDGCGKELTWWLKRVKPRPPSKVKPKPKKKKKVKKRQPKTMDDLPMECRSVLAARPSSVEASLQRGKNY